MNKRYSIYEGTRESRDTSDAFDTLQEAIARAKTSVENAKDMGFDNYVAHVIDESGEFIHTESFNYYI